MKIAIVSYKLNSDALFHIFLPHAASQPEKIEKVDNKKKKKS